MYNKSGIRVKKQLELLGILILLIITSMTACTSQNKLAVDRTPQNISPTSIKTTSSPVIQTTPIKTTSSPVIPTTPIVTILTTSQPGSSNPYEDNYVLFNNRSSDYLRVTSTLRQYDSKGYFQQDYQFDTIYYVIPNSYWAISTSLTKASLQFCKVVNIKSERLLVNNEYCNYQPIGEFTVEKTKLNTTINGVVQNNSTYTPVGMVLQTFFYDQSDAIIAVRIFLAYAPYAPPGEKKQITDSVHPVPPYTHTKTTIIARR